MVPPLLFGKPQRWPSFLWTVTGRAKVTSKFVLNTFNGMFSSAYSAIHSQFSRSQRNQTPFHHMPVQSERFSIRTKAGPIRLDDQEQAKVAGVFCVHGYFCRAKVAGVFDEALLLDYAPASHSNFNFPESRPGHSGCSGQCNGRRRFCCVQCYSSQVIAAGDFLNSFLMATGPPSMFSKTLEERLSIWLRDVV